MKGSAPRAAPTAMLVLAGRCVNLVCESVVAMLSGVDVGIEGGREVVVDIGVENVTMVALELTV
jgi:hypothetical protein